MGLLRKILNNKENDVYKMKWGNITPELYSEQKKSCIHIFNHLLEGQANIDRCIRFAIGRLEWYKTVLPVDCKQEVIFDDRGQEITDSDREYVELRLKAFANEINFMSKR